MIRKFAAVAVVAGVMLGTAGCNMITHVATAEVYAPSDGAMVDNGAVKARNFLMLTDGPKHILIGSLVNGSKDAVSATIEFADNGSTKTAQVNLTGEQAFNMGYAGTAAQQVVSDAKAGSLVEVAIVVAGNKTTMSVPVLDGTLPEYKAVLDAN